MKLSIALTVALLAAPAFAAELAIPITVQEPSGVAQKSAPVSGGIPLPWGEYRKENDFLLFDGPKLMNAQVLPLVTDERGFLRWVLLDFQADLKANEKRTFRLKVFKQLAAARKVNVINRANGVTVDMGRLRYTIAKEGPFTLFTSLSIDGKPVVTGGEVSYTDITKAEKRYVAGKPESIVVEYDGPMRTTVCVRGRFVGDDASKLRYIARITAWRNRTDVHLKYSLANSNSEHYTYRRIKDSSVRLNLAGSVAGTLIGATQPQALSGGASVTRGLHAVKGHTTVLAGDKLLWAANGRNESANGWIAARVGAAAVFACDRYFNDDPPRRMATTANTLVLSGIVPRFDGPEITRRGTKVRIGHPMGDKHRWLFDCAHLDSQYVIDFSAPADTARLDGMARAARYPLHAMAPPGWYFETGGLSCGRFGTQKDELKCYDTWGWKYDARRKPQGPRDRRRYVAGEDNHYETEEDIVEALVLMYVRTGSRAYYDVGEAWANYNMALQQWRTDGWRWKDGGVWWLKGGPLGNRPVRERDPVTGCHTSVPMAWTRNPRPPFNLGSCRDLYFMGNSKQCYCHNWGAGLSGWFCLTGDRDALEAAIDSVEQNIDTQARTRRRRPGDSGAFSRDFTRSCRLTNAARLIAPNDEFVRQASDHLAQVYIKRPDPEPRGFTKRATKKIDMMQFKFENFVGNEGMVALKKAGTIIDPYNGMLTNFGTKARWSVLINPHTWMYPPLSRAMESYYRLTGDEDAMDWVIAYGQAVANYLYQPAHHTLHSSFMLDFPLKGVCKDLASWTMKKPLAEGMKMSGYLTRFHPDVPARAYALCGEPLLKERAKLIWYGGSHRGYGAEKMHNLEGVGSWVNYYGPHSETVGFTGRTFYIWAHPKKDPLPPKDVSDLEVTVDGQKVTVTFTAPADQGGGRVVKYQVKCSDKPILSYQDFMKAWANNTDKKRCNWWMATNLNGEPRPKAPGAKETFVVTGLPEYTPAKYFAVRSFDDSHNRSMVSNLAQPGR